MRETRVHAFRRQLAAADLSSGINGRCGSAGAARNRRVLFSFSCEDQSMPMHECSISSHARSHLLFASAECKRSWPIDQVCPSVSKLSKRLRRVVVLLLAQYPL